MVWLIPSYGGRGFGGSVSPKFMPYIGATIMMCASAMVWIPALVALLNTRARLLGPVPLRSVFLQIWPFAFVGLAIVAITWGGLIYSGPIVIGALLLILGERRLPVILGASLVPPGLIWVLATQLMRVGMV